MLDSDDLGDDGSVSPGFLYFEGLTVQFEYIDRSVATWIVHSRTPLNIEPL